MLGNLKISVLCLGGMNFAELEQSKFDALLDGALEGGINLLDTADVYGKDGASEGRIGRWLERSGRRRDVLIATKFGLGRRYAEADVRARVATACEASLRRLRSDVIDLFQVHMPLSDAPEPETLDALNDLVRQGKVREIGCCNYPVYRFMEGLAESARKGLARWASMQMQYSLLERSIEREHVSACIARGIGLMAWAPLAAGFLTGKYRQGAGWLSGTRLATDEGRRGKLDTDANWRILADVRRVASEMGVEPAQVSLAWLIDKPSVSGVVFGVRTMDQLGVILRSADLVLPDEHVKSLDEVSAPVTGYP